MTRKDLPEILYKIIKDLGGSARMMEIFQKFWALHGKSLSERDDLFYTWNYDIRWAATQLRKQKRMKKARTKENTHGADISPTGVWELR